MMLTMLRQMFLMLILILFSVWWVLYRSWRQLVAKGAAAKRRAEDAVAALPAVEDVVLVTAQAVVDSLPRSVRADFVQPSDYEVWRHERQRARAYIAGLPDGYRR